MSEMIEWIAAEAERPEVVEGAGFPRRRRLGEDAAKGSASIQGLGSHQFPVRVPGHPPGDRAETSEEAGAQSPPFAKNAKGGAAASTFLTSTSPTSPPFDSLRAGLPAKEAGNEAPAASLVPEESPVTAIVESAEEVEDRVREGDRERRIYRGRTVAMLRRYMRYSIETGRLPSLLGGEIFRAKVTSYTVVTFEDRVIFVHDMGKCLGRLDEFSRQLIARHVLQEHDQAATGKLLHCTERTVRTYIPVVLDLLSEILVEVGLLERLDSDTKKSCQGGKNDQIGASDCDDGKYKV
jgi:hypothetical protein